MLYLCEYPHVSNGLSWVVHEVDASQRLDNNLPFDRDLQTRSNPCFNLNNPQGVGTTEADEQVIQGLAPTLSPPNITYTYKTIVKHAQLNYIDVYTGVYIYIYHITYIYIYMHLFFLAKGTLDFGLDPL